MTDKTYSVLRYCPCCHKHLGANWSHNIRKSKGGALWKSLKGKCPHCLKMLVLEHQRTQESEADGMSFNMIIIKNADGSGHCYKIYNVITDLRSNANE